MDQVKKLTVSEAFYSIQGEGKTMGVPSVFIRLAGCNLMCGGKGTEKDKQLHHGATWRCDSIEVWRKGHSYIPEELSVQLNTDFNFIKRIREGAHLIFTGGEPLLQIDAIVQFVRHLKFNYGLNPYIEIETNGTIFPSEDFNYELQPQYNISPKLANSGEPHSLRIKAEALTQFVYNTTNRQFKFVVSSYEDVKEIQTLISACNIPNNLIWLMPAASDQQELNLAAEKLAATCITFGYNYSHRLHIAIWNKKTGV